MVCWISLANGALSGGGEEHNIRQQLIENDLVEAIVICQEICSIPQIFRLLYGY